MYKGGSKEKKARSTKVIRYSGLFIPVALIMYFSLMIPSCIKEKYIINATGMNNPEYLITLVDRAFFSLDPPLYILCLLYTACLFFYIEGVCFFSSPRCILK